MSVSVHKYEKLKETVDKWREEAISLREKQENINDNILSLETSIDKLLSENTELLEELTLLKKNNCNTKKESKLAIEKCSDKIFHLERDNLLKDSKIQILEDERKGMQERYKDIKEERKYMKEQINELKDELKNERKRRNADTTKV